VSDPTVKALGSTTESAASPRRLLVSTVGDELKLASLEPKGAPDAPKVFGVSLKDRSAILPVGRGADGAYWWDTKTGSFVTSTYYVRDIPEWVRSFNDRKLADADAGASWTALSAQPRSLRQLPAERGAALYEAIYGSPYGNDLLVDFVSELLRHERLGTRNATDLLTVSFSSNDSVGHTYGPDSDQVHDIAVRTDRTIGRLLGQIDKTIGLGHTLVAFTADHGVGRLPEVLRDRGLPGGRMTSTDLFDPIQRALVSRFGDGKWLMSTAGSSPYLNNDLIETLKLDQSEVRRVGGGGEARRNNTGKG
jgi:hypothetical protein